MEQGRRTSLIWNYKYIWFQTKIAQCKVQLPLNYIQLNIPNIKQNNSLFYQLIVHVNNKLGDVANIINILVGWEKDAI